MTPIETLLHCADIYAAAKGLRESSLSTYMLNHSRKLGTLRDGTSDIGTKQLAKAFQWLSDRWPDGASWPEGIERPIPVVASEVGDV